VIQEEVPASAARFFGHVCGVIAVAMAALSGWGLWQVGTAALHGRVGWSQCLVLIPVGLTALLLRWTGVLMGYWSTHGRLSVPPSVYAAFGILCAGISLVGLKLLVTWPLSVWHALMITAGVVCGAALAYWCYLLLSRRRR
jgi:hypothetical protein